MARGLAVWLLALLVWSPMPAQAERRMAIATAGTAGALYPMGVAMAETINRHAKDFKASAEASAGSLENLRNLAAGKVEWGISQNEMAFLAYRGEAEWKGRPQKNLRSLFGTLLSWLQVFVPAESKLASVGDFKGKRVGLGSPGSGGERAAHKLLGYYGITYKDIHPEFISDSEMVAALKDGTLDAMITTHPLRSAALMDLTTGMAVRLIPVSDEGFYRQYPYYTLREVPGGTYVGINQAVGTPVSRVVMYTSTAAKFGEDEIHALLTAIWDHAEEWLEVHSSVRSSTSLAAALEGLRVPRHPGAVRFYRERGLAVPPELVVD